MSVLVLPLAMVMASGVLAAAADKYEAQKSSLEGRWRLDAQASDDAAAVLKKALAEHRKSEPAERAPRPPIGPETGTGPGGAPGGEGGATESSAHVTTFPGPMGTGRESVARRLLPAQEMTLTRLTPDGLRIFEQDRGTREYTVGQSSMYVDADGRAKVESEWDGASFVITATSGSRARAQATYSVDPELGRLVVVHRLKSPQTGKVEYRSVYMRVSDGQTATSPPLDE